MRAPTTWAALAAIGASAVCSALSAAALEALSLEPLPQGGWFQHLSEERVIEWSGLAAGAVGVAVAGWLGGARATALFLVYFVSLTAIAVSSALDSVRLCQDRLGCFADLPVSLEDALLRQSPSVIGVAIGGVVTLLSRGMRPVPAHALEATGVCALILLPIGILAGVQDVRSGPVAILPSLPDVPALIASAALAAAAGLVIAARSPTPSATTLRFAASTAVLLLPASTSAAIHGRVEGMFAVVAASLMVGVVTGLAAMLGRRARATAA